MPDKTILIRVGTRHGNNPGADIKTHGFANLPVRMVILGTRLTHRRCESSKTLIYQDDTIPVVEIDGVDYALEPLKLGQYESDKFGDTAVWHGCHYEVTIPHTANIEFLEPCQESKNTIRILPLRE